MVKLQNNRKAVSVAELYKTKHKVIPFENEWADSFGKPEKTGSWIVWGNSSNGKTSLALQLAKYFAEHGLRVIYNSLEEGASLSMKNAFYQVGMDSVKNKVVLLDQEPIEDMKIRLRRRKSANVVFIDSLQYTGLNYNEYKQLRDEFRDKIFVFVSHADGKNPAGRIAARIRFDANVKIWVEGYKAYPQSRYGGNKPFIIWQEGADNYGG